VSSTKQKLPAKNVVEDKILAKRLFKRKSLHFRKKATGIEGGI